MIRSMAILRRENLKNPYNNAWNKTCIFTNKTWIVFHEGVSGAISGPDGGQVKYEDIHRRDELLFGNAVTTPARAIPLVIASPDGSLAAYPGTRPCITGPRISPSRMII